MASTLIGINSSSWMIVWVALEVNTLSMSWILAKDFKDKKSQRASTFLYYLIQVIASRALLLCLISESRSIIWELLTLRALGAKIGIWPIHYWYIKIIQELGIKERSFFLIITWQKILPLLTITIITKRIARVYWIWVCARISIIAIITKIRPHSSTKRVMALSSLNNNGWIIICVTLSRKVFALFIIIYSITLKGLIRWLRKIESKVSWIPFSSWAGVIIMANLRGLPPFSIFWVKIKVIWSCIKSSTRGEITLFLITTTTVMLYYYLWVVLSFNLKKIRANKTKKSRRNKWVWTITTWSLVSAWVRILLGDT